MRPYSEETMIAEQVVKIGAAREINSDVNHIYHCYESAEIPELK